ncbi:hypothetical protein RGQ29_003491 [Quercus rubra]|uniref:Uncharacterized protein n=1 Tax=Quercus rubra TaxID=3512 RepID=A0AAN7EBW0_QUERU|nr:hypothetical protein RGQ29_003491 [Quercus rubra]
MVNPHTDKLVRKTTMVATMTASYFLLTADYGSKPNALNPICVPHTLGKLILHIIFLSVKQNLGHA